MLSMRRAMRGFIGPADIFRNPQAIFCLFEPPAQADASPFDLTLATAGDDFAVMGMHFKLGLYEHQSAGAIQGVIDLIADRADAARRSGPAARHADSRSTSRRSASSATRHKRDPQTRQSADHSMLYIVATLLRKAYEARRAGWDGQDGWQRLMLTPADYAEDESALFHPLTRRLMQQIDFRHGGPEFDRTLSGWHSDDGRNRAREAGPAHERPGDVSAGPRPQHDCDELPSLLEHKFRLLAGPASTMSDALVARFTNLAEKSPQEIAELYDFQIRGADAECSRRSASRATSRPSSNRGGRGSWGCSSPCGTW